MHRANVADNRGTPPSTRVRPKVASRLEGEAVRRELERELNAMNAIIPDPRAALEAIVRALWRSAPAAARRPPL